MWGDDWEHWDELNDAVDECWKLAEASAINTLQIKEKYGTLRWYCPEPASEIQKRQYREIYRILVHKYPTIVDELLCCADWGDLLVGLVDPKTCKHASIWESTDRRWCAVCGKDQPKRTTKQSSQTAR